MSFIIFKGLSVVKNCNRPGSAPLGSLEIFFESLYAPYVYSVFFLFVCFNLLFIFTCCPHLQALLRNVSDVFEVWVLFCTCISYCWIVSPSKFEVYKKVRFQNSSKYYNKKMNNSQKLCQISKYTYFEEHLRTTASKLYVRKKCGHPFVQHCIRNVCAKVNNRL